MRIIPCLLHAIITCLRPLFGPPGCCPFDLSCTEFAQMELTDKPLFTALISIGKRVLICTPLLALYSCPHDKT